MDIANNLACWLKNEFGLNAFVDSTVWGYSDDLLYRIDNDYCLLENNGKRVFDYNKRNYTTTQIHIILVSALREMIADCECILFLNTDNSISFDMSKEVTDSAWIFDELQTIRFIQKKLPKREVKSVTDKSIPVKDSVPLFKYSVNKEIGKLAKIDIETLVEWKNRCRSNKLNDIPTHPLDVLYKIVKEE
ncbi:hypothetical protein [Limosilactobacillus caviae]|uniref:hypothetical protein n=1 Tax=Limosilactobacillus caviae TaxID=1769424 RepID=UPI003512BB37